MTPILIAHRCGPGLYPEQSIAAARHALSLGADLVEMDVQYTRDGHPVICHDPNTGRVFGVDRLCRDMTLQEFMSLRHVRDRSCPSHSLSDVLDCGVRPLLLHCKFSGEPLRHMVRLIREKGAGDQCVIGVQSAGDVALVRAACPALRVLAFMPGPEQLNGFLRSGAEYIRLWEDWVTEARVEAIHCAGRRVWIMAGQPDEAHVGCTDAENLRHWARLGADGILLNDIRRGREILSAEKA